MSEFTKQLMKNWFRYDDSAIPRSIDGWVADLLKIITELEEVEIRNERLKAKNVQLKKIINECRIRRGYAYSEECAEDLEQALKGGE